ncbi:hypothetical protein CCHOA_01720 [Corynebacterium choanae]|uniref:Uncharacterized protein n=2 Tax=Corynebacterium choanae TaxID=1862358 RepID=A0A3G6J4E2_9CORY|nr:hypothetical protein CCHOA_01720 [Corynebacterium choanae]
MLVLCSVHNYRSHHDPTVLNLVDPATWVCAHGPSATTCTVLHSPSAGGVTSLLAPLASLSESNLHPIGSATTVEQLYQPHLAQLARPCKFHLTYVHDGFHFRWQVNVDARGVAEEEVFYHKQGATSWELLFQHRDDEVVFGSSANVSPADQAMIAQASGKMAVALPALRSTKKSSPSKAASTFFTRQLVCIRDGGAQAPLSRIIYRHIAANPELLRIIPAAMTAGGFDTAGIGVNSAKLTARLKPVAKLFGTIEPLHSPEQVRAMIRAHKQGNQRVAPPWPHVTLTDLARLLPHAAITHKTGFTTYSLALAEHSQTAQTWCRVSLSAGVTLLTGGTLVIDNADSFLTPRLVTLLQEWFCDETLNPLRAQLVLGIRNPELAAALSQGPINFRHVALRQGASVLHDEIPEDSTIAALRTTIKHPTPTETNNVPLTCTLSYLRQLLEIHDH